MGPSQYTGPQDFLGNFVVLLLMQDTGLVRMRLALLATCFSTVWAGLVPTLRFWTSRT